MHSLFYRAFYSGFQFYSTFYSTFYNSYNRDSNRRLHAHTRGNYHLSQWSKISISINHWEVTRGYMAGVKRRKVRMLWCER